MRILGVILGVLLLAVGCFVGVYNSLKTARIEVDAQYGQVENQIQRRADLIPNLVNTVKGYMQHARGSWAQAPLRKWLPQTNSFP